MLIRVPFSPFRVPFSPFAFRRERNPKCISVLGLGPNVCADRNSAPTSNAQLHHGELAGLLLKALRSTVVPRISRFLKKESLELFNCFELFNSFGQFDARVFFSLLFPQVVGSSGASGELTGGSAFKVNPGPRFTSFIRTEKTQARSSTDKAPGLI